ncbi:MAG TPA: response regulator transcription factor [Roseiflexaceae bacterium]|nr:response regulator transcription factor [Roseiflexaceae bacterium]
MRAQPETQIRIVMVDDHAVLRAGLRMIIESQPGMRVIGEAHDRATALAIASETHPDIILLDLDLGKDSGFELLPELLAAAPQTRVIVLTGLRDTEAHRRAIVLGAVGLILKEHAVATVLKAIEKVHAGEAWLDRAMIGSILNNRMYADDLHEHNADLQKIATLTEREREVIGLISIGLPSQEIMERLAISEATLRHHLSSIFSKLGVRDRVQLVVYAYQHGLAQRDQ